MNKLDRISGILVMLQSRRIVTAQKIATQFNVSMRTVYRDIRVLEESGVPITGNAGVGYSLIDGYKLPPLMFTADEAIAFLMAEKVVSRKTDKDNYNLYCSGMNKIRAVLHMSEKDVLENIDNYIIMTDDYTHNQPQTNNVLQPLLRNIINRKTVEIVYHANYNQEVSTRIIEPLGLFYMADTWYILAYCQLREDYRTFKINRIKAINLMEHTFCKQHDNLKNLIKNLYHTDEEEIHVHLRTNITALRIIATGKYINGLYEEKVQGEYVDQFYKITSLEHFARWFLSFADQACIVEPPELKEKVKEIISGIRV